MWKTAAIDPALIRDAAIYSLDPHQEPYCSWLALVQHLFRALKHNYFIVKNPVFGVALKDLKQADCNLWGYIRPVLEGSHRLVSLEHIVTMPTDSEGLAQQLINSPLVDIYVASDSSNLSAESRSKKVVTPLTYASSEHAEDDATRRVLFPGRWKDYNQTLGSHLASFMRWADHCMLVDKQIAKSFYEYFCERNHNNNWPIFKESITELYAIWCSARHRIDGGFEICTAGLVPRRESFATDHKDAIARLTVKLAECCNENALPVDPFEPVEMTQARMLYSLLLAPSAGCDNTRMRVRVIHPRSVSGKSAIAHDRWIINEKHKVAINCSAGLDIIRDGKVNRPIVLSFVDRWHHSACALHELKGPRDGVWPPTNRMNEYPQ